MEELAKTTKLKLLFMGSREIVESCIIKDYKYLRSFKFINAKNEKN